MIARNLIVKCDKCTVIDEEQLQAFVEDKLFSADMEYNGLELDNPADFIDEEMVETFGNTTYITFHFNHPVDLDESTARNVVSEAIKANKIQRIASDGKDVEVHLN